MRTALLIELAIVRFCGAKVDAKTAKSKSESKSKGKNLVKFFSVKYKVFGSRLGFLTPGARQAFTKLRQAFIKVSIFHYFDLDCHIKMETDISDYVISGVFSQLALDISDQWYPMVIFLRKMILVETRYKTHNGKLLAIVEVFKTWHHYLEGCKYEIFIFMDHNNLHRLINTKSISSK